VPIPHAGGTFPPKAPHFIPAGILTVTSTWTKPLGATFQKNLLSLPRDASLQLGCVIQEGAFEVSVEDAVKITISAKENALVSFFFYLLSRLQPLGTAPAIDINAYAKLVSQPLRQSGFSGKKNNFTKPSD
jgi:hypothetical protein